MTDSNLSAPRSPGPAGRRHMGAQIQECHGRAWAPRAGAAHTGLALRGPRALTLGVPPFPGPRHAARTAHATGRPAIPRTDPRGRGTPRVSHLDSALPGAASRVRPGSVCGRASSAPGRSPRSLRPSWALAARRSPRSPAAHVTPRAPRRLAGGSASGARPIG